VKEEYHRWHSNRIQKDFEMLVFGHTGVPVIIFPTTYNRYYEQKDQGLIRSIAHFINEGRIKVYCPDSLDVDNWYNTHIHPADRARNYFLYEEIIQQEVIPRAMYETNRDKVIMAGCSFGGFHATNLCFRNPDKVSYLMSLGAKFDVSSFLDGYYDDNCYRLNPADYVKHIEGGHLEAIRKIGIILSAGEHDICRTANEQFSTLLGNRGIHHWLDLRPRAVHDWPAWHEALPIYMKRVLGN
jgi:esterase/lipase superfamily enzyme